MANKKQLILAAGIGLIVSNIIPTPGDALYFYQKRKNIKKLNNKELTPAQFWSKDAFGYYVYNSLWWTAVLAGSLYLATDLKKPSSQVFLGLTGLAAVGTVLYTNIKAQNE